MQRARYIRLHDALISSVLLPLLTCIGPAGACSSRTARRRDQLSPALLLLILASVGGFCSPAWAGVADTPLPRFSDGRQSEFVMTASGVVKRGRLQTVFTCTPREPAPVHIGVEIFGPDGQRLNDIRDQGAVLGVEPRQTATISTSATTAYLESIVVALPSFSHGSARVVATSKRVECAITIVDDAVSPPVSLASVPPGIRPATGAALAGASLPRFSDGRQATHAALFPGVIKRDRVQTAFLCTSLSRVALPIGVEVFRPDGSRENDISSGNGEILEVGPGATVTFGTTGTAALLETTVISMRGVAQGLARVVTTSSDVLCTALVLDAEVTPPLTMSSVIPGHFFRPGDLNQDGVSNAADLTALVRQIFGQ